MIEELVAVREYSDGEIVIKFSIIKPKPEQNYFFSHVLVDIDGLNSKRYKIVGVDSLHCLALALMDCVFHIQVAASSSKNGLLFHGDRDLGLPDALLKALD